MVPMATYFIALLGALSICALAALVAHRPKRPCPRCELRMAIAARRCRFCAYELP
jgi:hypothetical protein